MYWPSLTIGSCSLLELGKVEEAIASPPADSQLGRTAEAKQMLTELAERKRRVYVSNFHLAIVHTGLGNDQTALDYLEEALKERRSEWMTHLRIDHRLRSLHDDPRFEAILRHVGI